MRKIPDGLPKSLAVEDLLRSRAVLSQILNSVTETIFWKDLDCVYLGCNEVFARAAGLDGPEQIVGMTDLDLPWRDQAAAYRADDREVMENNRPKRHIIEPVPQADGTTLWVDTTKVPLTDEAGRVYGVLGVYRDISEHKAAEGALRASEAQLSNALKIARLAPWEYDVALDRFTFNDPFYDIFRTTAEEVGGYTMSSADYARRFIHPEDVPIVAAEVRKALKTDDPRYSRQVEHRVLYADGEIGHIAVQFGVVKNEQGRTVRTFGVNQDITEHRRLEEQLRQSQKMEAVGRLAGGVAHDFNNILTVIQGYGELLRSEFHTDDPRGEQLAEILRGAERAANLTRQLLAFSRRQVLQPRLIRLEEVVGDIEKMLRRLIGEDLELQIVRPDGGWPVRADPGQIEQVVMNLAVNARDAMPEGGRLTVEVLDLTLDRPLPVFDGAVPPGSWVVLSVGDTGHGMDAETLEQIFQPFFTTKEAGKGTGLGLATVWGIVKQSGGFIGVETVPEKGTTFRVYLPRAEGEASGLRPAVRAPGGTETILLVEDEDPVRKLVCQQLEAAGYKVLAARSADEALRLSQENPGSIHLLLTDVVMPKRGGPDLAETLLRDRPGIKVLLMSGYTPDLPAYRTAVTSGWRILQKPFSDPVLRQAVREALEG